LRRMGLLLIPEERVPPAVLVKALELQRELSGAGASDAISQLLTDQRLLAAHRAMLPPARRRSRQRCC